MITRPLDLASRLRPAPRNFDAWFYVNAGFLVFFFYHFASSRFILAPGLGVDFQLPRVAGAAANATAATQHISVKESGQIVGNDGPMDLVQLRAWLKGEAARTPSPSLLVSADARVQMAVMTEIVSAATESGFRVTLAAEEPDRPAGEGR